MTMKLAKRGGLSILALAVALTGTASSASAEQNLFDILFGNRATRQRVQEPPRQATAPAPRVAAPKISAPSFYNYRPEAPVKVDFAALTVALEQEDGEKRAASSPFVEALDGLAGFELLAEKEIAEALVTHYERNPAFIWVEGTGPNGKADAVLRVLNDAAAFGLSETDYAVNVPLAASAVLDTPAGRRQALIRLEMALSARALRYARDARLGRVDPNKLSGYHDFPKKPLVEAAVLEVLAGAKKPADYLESLHPQNTLYAALRKELKALRASAEKEIVVDTDTFVRPGSSHPEFPKILQIIERDANPAFRAEHGEVLVAHAGSETYAQELVPVVKAAQKLHDLNPDGIIGRRTVGALAGESKQARIEKVLLALERLRWHPSHLGSRRVMINAASFTATYLEGDRETLSMRVVVGKPSNQTSFFHDEIEYVEFNPYWGVPRSILVNEKLPKLRRDPGYLDRAGYEVTDSRGRRVSSASVNWNRYGTNIPFSVRQPPGPKNALGELKIMFPNKHSIYMHDTPAKDLFSRDTRAYSHGCVRLQDPRAMAAAVLGTSVDEIGREVGKGRNARRDAPQKIPVYVGYFTAWPEAAGEVTYHADIYGRDDNLRKALAKVEETRAPGS
ncbi:L,D-transpeptidase family protein [Chelativorans salis]|uniref:L,D-transpeptidase family protein n=1 Tax=Chelativorans salis TaxID=2978478 RepID=A0ABT2LM45_9HYPH|nr:L,D-transpeptidase family protein [Chelativorans sp. EGI FJ00035]MCT7375512.1 L,D-transpeptidase family protein [Chelativorans sp. EGI FJ00035]